MNRPPSDRPSPWRRTPDAPRRDGAEPRGPAAGRDARHPPPDGSERRDTPWTRGGGHRDGAPGERSPRDAAPRGGSPRYGAGTRTSHGSESGRPGDAPRDATRTRDPAAARAPGGPAGVTPHRAGHAVGTGAQRHAPDASDDAARREGPRGELRLYGLNALRAVFARRPDAIRKVYLAEARIPALQPLLKWCVAHRVGYRVVDEGDLQKLAASAHHEGVVADVLREEPLPLSTWLRDLRDGPACAIWLDGVGNPHNFGAILRSAAHFGVSALLLPKDSTLALSGAAARVAEGGAEAVPLVRLGRSDNALAQLRGAGFVPAATVVEGGEDAFAAPLPARLVYVMGAEGEGMDRALAQACDLRLSIPGSGAVESLNVAAATAVFLAAWSRAQRG